MNTIFITGSSSGIGKATAKLFAQKGWTVIATMRKPEKEIELTQYENVKLFPLDITNKEQVENTINEVLSHYEVDVLFNNVGSGMKARFEDVEEEVMWQSIDTNLMGMIRVTQKFVPYFKKRKSGIIMTTTSLGGEIGFPLDSVYSLDKWGLTGLCEMLYFELAPHNIQVKTLVPGIVRTNFQIKKYPLVEEEYEKIAKRQYDLVVPIEEEAEQPEEAALDVYNAICDTNKDRMAYVTGKVAKELCELRQKIGNEEFRKFFKNKIVLNKE